MIVARLPDGTRWVVTAEWLRDWMERTRPGRLLAVEPYPQISGGGAVS